MAETKRPSWYVTDQERLKKQIDDHSKVLVRVEAAVTGLQRRFSMMQSRCDALEKSCQCIAQQNETLAVKQQRITAGCDGLKGGLEAVTDRVAAIASGVDSVAGCVLEFEGRLQRLRLDNASGNLNKSSWMKELGQRFEELSALHASHDVDILSGKLTEAICENSFDSCSARTSTTQASEAPSPEQCSYSDSPQSRELGQRFEELSALCTSYDVDSLSGKLTDAKFEKNFDGGSAWMSTPTRASVAASHGSGSYLDSPRSSAHSELHDALTQPAIEEQSADLQAAKHGLGTGDSSKHHQVYEQAGRKLGRHVIRVMPPATGTARSPATEHSLQKAQERHVLPRGGCAPPRPAGYVSVPPPMAPSCPP
jgi:hypothetical protein